MNGEEIIQGNAVHTGDVVNIYVNHTLLDPDVDPVIRNDRTLVPLRGIFEALGAKVDWDGDTHTVTATVTRDGTKTTVITRIGSDIMEVNDQSVQLDVAPILLDPGYTMVPIRAITEAFGDTVDWNNRTRSVMITSRFAVLPTRRRTSSGTTVPTSGLQPSNCVICGGLGQIACTLCNGSGTTISGRFGLGAYVGPTRCSRCSGRGSIRCPGCGGTGRR